MREETVTEIRNGFREPPPGYGIVPFYWWLGDKVTKEKLLYHLEQLKEHHISGLQINYAHSDKGGQSFGLTYPGEPAVFSEEWWELLGWFLQEAKKRKIAVSLSDYTLGSPGQGYYADWILRKYPQMQGCLLACSRRTVKKGEKVRLEKDGLVWEEEICVLPEEWNFLSAVICTEKGTVLTEMCREEGKSSVLQMEAAGEFILVFSYRKEFSIDPMYPGVGEAYIDNFFGKFEEHFPGECGKGLNFFFSDELNFNVSGNLWNIFFAGEFRKRKGYDILPLLYLIFEEGRPEAVKIRLDYYDVIVQLEEENYFSKIYQWHEERNMTYGCDHGGRGKDVIEFGDYMRTQKYNQGVGCDQPGLQSDIIKNKVAASISHLYERKRVWLEGFYGSGWGTTTGQLTDAIARNFVMGHNLLSLHGFYYSTHGCFWEWAPPCNCVRAPYWEDMKTLTGAVERMSYLLSRGAHRCGIGIVYPVAAVEGGIDGKRAVDTAFALGEVLYQKGLDFDFLDFESILRAELKQGSLVIGKESYEWIILPDMKTVRGGMYRALAQAVQKEVRVLAVGGWPVYADMDITEAGEILGRKGVVLQDINETMEYLSKKVERDVIPAGTTAFYKNHRIVSGLDIYMTYGIPEGELCYFRGKGRVYLLNPWTGMTFWLEAEREEADGVWVKMPVESAEFPLLALGDMGEAPFWKGKRKGLQEHTLDQEWDFHLLPTLDNTWGDFELPESAGVLPCMVKELHREDSVCKVGYGPFFLYKEAFSNEKDFFMELEAAVQEQEEGYRNYVFSLRYGVEGDPGHQGYHGLKAQITNDFLQIGTPEKTQTDVCMKPYENGTGKIFITWIYAEKGQEARILTGDIRPEKLYVNGKDVTGETYVELTAGRNRVVAGYLENGRTHLVFVQQDYSETGFPLSMRWYKMRGMLPFTLPKRSLGQSGTNAPFWFISPPALEELSFAVHGKLEKITVGGLEATLKQDGNQIRAVCQKICKECCRVEIFLTPEPGYLDGAIFDGPLTVKCGTGKMKAGDWSQIDALKYYSGGASYSQEIMWEENTGKQAWLEMEHVVSSAEVYINSELAGIRVAPPWRVEVGELLHPGRNQIEIRVYNTLGNQYEYFPTRYKSGIESGLIGDVSLWTEVAGINK